MATKRVPIHRATRPRISDEAVDIFRQMQCIRCTCGPPRLRKVVSRPEIGQFVSPGEVWEDPPECHGCKQWDALHDRLAEALRWTPETWQVYCIPPPRGGWHGDLEVKLQSELEAALAERSPGSWRA
jgi:hypothetical protein